MLDRLRSRLAAATAPTPAEPQDPSASDLALVHQRLDRLEAMVEGLQDALYRQASAQDERFERIDRKTEPEEIARALSEDARRRGL